MSRISPTRAPRPPHDGPGDADARRRRGRRSVGDALAGFVLAALVCAGGWALLREPASPPHLPPPPGTLAEGVVGPPTRESARYQAQHRAALTVEEYETIRAARF